MLPLIEDELDVRSHSWAPSTRQAAGIPPLAAQAQAAAEVAAFAGGSGSSGVTAVTSAASPASLSDGRTSLLPASPWALVAGRTAQQRGLTTWQQGPAAAAAYAQQRVQHMMGMLSPAAPEPQLAL